MRRRGGKKRNKNSRLLSFYFLNINGYQSKKDSLELIKESLKPDIIALVETKVSKSKVFDTEWLRYECVNRNCSRGKGGILCAFRKGTFRNLKNVTHVDDDRILTCRCEYQNKTVRVIVVYGLQENDDSEEKSDFFINLSIEIERSLNAGDGIIVVGDMNAKLEMDTEGNIVPDSGNGRLLLNTVCDFDLEVVNFADCCKGTWTYSKDVLGVNQKSRLDYLITDREVFKSVQELEIDEDKIFCPFHEITEKGDKRIVYSDHNPLICKLKILTPHIKPPKEPRWIITLKGLDQFNRETAKGSFKKCSDYSDLQEAIFEKMKLCFRRVWKRQREEEICCSKKQLMLLKCLNNFKKGGKAQRSIIKKYITKVHVYIAEKIADMKKRRVQKTVSSITVDGKFSPNEFWKLKKSLCPKATKENSSVRLENGDEICGDNAIKEAYRQEFLKRLRHNKIDDKYANYEVLTNLLCELYATAAKSMLSPDFTFEEAMTAIKSLRNKKAPGCDQVTNEILKNAGDGLVEEMVEVINNIKKSSKSPDEWNKVLITTLFKKKGSKKDLINYRGVFLTSCISKLCEKLILLRIEDPINSVSLAQCGATRGKSPADNVFILNACIDHAKYLNTPLYLAFYDFQQCFDKLWLEDCLVGLWKIGVRNEMLSLILAMNEETEIVVQSPCGKTEPFRVNRIVKQGTVLGPQLCKVSTAEYGKDTPGYQLGTVNIKPPIFVDDILNILNNIGDMQDAHRRALLFALRKRLSFGVLKCVFMIINGKKMDVSPVLEIDDHIMEQVMKTKYVGDIFNQQGTNEDLIKDRVTKGRGTMISLIALCEESGLGKYTVQSMILLYMTVFISALIFNCQSWSHITKSNITSLEKLQLKFLKLILRLPLSTPNVFIFLEYGILPLGHEIQKRRMIYLHHILTLRDEDPVSLSYHQGLRLSHEPNWANDVKKIRLVYGITASDEEISRLTITEWKRTVTSKVQESVFQELVGEARGASKTQDLEYQQFSCQEYLWELDAYSARKIARLRSRTFSCKANHKSSHSDLSCRAGCLVVETQEHLVNCSKIQGNVTEIDLAFVKKANLECDGSRIRDLLKRMEVAENWCDD